MFQVENNGDYNKSDQMAETLVHTSGDGKVWVKRYKLPFWLMEKDVGF